MPIPQWNANGVLPPVNPAMPTLEPRSPYRVELVELMSRFGISVARINILRGLLGLRQAIYNIGITNGFQWIDGSFLENIELIESRDPHDIDVVTFYHLPQGSNQASILAMNPRLFSPRLTKQDFMVDAYYVDLNPQSSEDLVDQAAYWYSLRLRYIQLLKAPIICRMVPR